MKWFSPRTWAVATGLAGALFLMGPEVVYAQSTPDPRQILQHIKEGNAHFDAEEWEDALSNYRAAFELFPDNSLLYRMGQTAENMGELATAVDYYAQFVEAVPDDPLAKKVSERLPNLRASLPRLVTVESSPAGAAVRLGSKDAEPVGTTPYEFELSPDQNVVYVTLEGYQPVMREITDEPGSKVSVSVSLRAVLKDAPRPVVDTGGGFDYRLWGMVSAGSGAALLVTGGVFSALAMQAEDDVNSYDKRALGASPDELQALKDDGSAYYNTSVGLYVVGGLALAGGATLLTIDLLQPASAEPGVALEVGPRADGGFSVGLNGRF